MPVEKWSENVAVVHLADDPQFTEDILSIEESPTLAKSDVVLDCAARSFRQFFQHRPVAEAPKADGDTGTPAGAVQPGNASLGNIPGDRIG